MTRPWKWVWWERVTQLERRASRRMFASTQCWSLPHPSPERLMPTHLTRMYSSRWARGWDFTPSTSQPHPLYFVVMTTCRFRAWRLFSRHSEETSFFSSSLVSFLLSVEASADCAGWTNKQGPSDVDKPDIFTQSYKVVLLSKQWVQYDLTSVTSRPHSHSL